jgi:hypothetical protein
MIKSTALDQAISMLQEKEKVWPAEKSDFKSDHSTPRSRSALPSDK